MMAIEIREIKFGSDDYRAELELRLNVLRQPLGLTRLVGDTEFDATDRHLGAFDDGRLVGCCLMRRLESVSGEIRQLQMKMRQVAIDPSVQGQGIGRLLVDEFERISRAQGATEIVLDARETAIAFYQRLGYDVVSDLFTQVTVPHKKMRKLL